MIGILILLGSFLFFLIAAAGIMKTKELEQENRLLHSYMRSMEEFYEGIQSRIEAVRKYRHDLAKHIQTLEALLEEKEQDDGVKEYMEDLKYRYEELKKHEFCTDELVNSILTIKEEQCRERGIPLDIRVQDCIYTGVEEVDLVGLLHNLLDNAIEANERIPAGEKRGSGFPWNTTAKKSGRSKNCLKMGRNSVSRQKTEKEEHGIGTKIIESLVEKYQGRRQYAVDTEHWMFEDEIRLKCKR